jgi:hypothetical protein
MPFTKQNAKRLGSKGGKATLAKYGRDHFRRLGAAGFAGLARRLGFPGGSRRGALQELIAKGRIRVSPATLRAQAEAQAWLDQFWTDFDPHNPTPTTPAEEIPF